MNENKPVKTQNSIGGWFPCMWFNGDVDPTADFAETAGQLRKDIDSIAD